MGRPSHDLAGLAGALALLLGCAGGAPPHPAPAPTPEVRVTAHRWRVFDGEVAILDVSDRPGPITSTAPPPPNGHLVMHPFLSAAALSAAHEDRLRKLLNASHDLPGFLASLTAAGFRVDAQP
jgi:hypothetical protein